MEQELIELKKERKILRDELIRAISLIKTCKDKEERQDLFAWKNEIKMDIAEVELEIELMEENEKNKVVEMDNNFVEDDRVIVDDTEEEPFEEQEQNEEETLTNNKQ
jgi:hypothetical protein